MRILPAVAIVVAFATSGTGQQVIDPDTHRYRGRVVDITGYPIPGVDVSCVGREDAVTRVKTDDRGEYVLASRHGVCGLLKFELDGFAPEGFSNPGGDVFDVTLMVGDLGEVVCLDPRLPGRVTNADGSPAADASIWMRRLGGDRTWGARTDANGRFAMLALCHRPEGDLSVCARGKGEHGGVGCVTFAVTPASVASGIRIRLSRVNR
jgi:hypothetical protein